MDHSVHFIDNDNIHEITVGTNPKEDLRFTVGNTYLKKGANPIVITGIEIDENYITDHGIIKAKIFGTLENGNGEEFLWKVLVDTPITITCKL